MRIAFDARCVFQGMGGIGNYALNILQELGAIDTTHEYICYFTHLGPPEPIRLPANFRTRKFQAGMIDERFDQLILPSLLAEDRADIYFNPTFSIPTIGTETLRISTIHDVVFRRHPDFVEPKLRAFLDGAARRACRKADGLITVSEFSRREICELYEVSPERIEVIPNGVHVPSGTTAPDRELRKHGLTPGKYILYVGSIEPKKNVDLLLRAFHGIGDSDLRLALAGPRGSCEYAIEHRIVELGLSNRVALLGYVEKSLLESLYHHAAAFVYPSFYEGFGLPPLEAMARGVPTIVSNASSLPEVVGDAALKVDPHSPKELIGALRTLLSDSTLRRDLTERGRRRATEFSWKLSASRHLEFFEKIHENRASRV